MVKTDKPMSMGSRIIAASDKGLAPADIAELLGTNIKYVYTTRCTEKNRRAATLGTVGAEMGTDHWFQQEIGVAKPKAPPPAKPKAKPNPAINAYQPKIAFIKEPKPSLFSRVKAAYAVLRGA